MFRVFHDAALGADVVGSMRRAPVDAVVVDCMLLGVLEAAERADSTTIVITHSLLAFWRRWARNPLTVLFSRRRGFNAARLCDSAGLNLITASPALDPAADATLVGESRGNRSWIIGPVVPAESAPADGDAVLVGLSSIAMPGQRAVLPPRAEVHRTIPHAEAMRRCSLVVGHGGHGTTMSALAHDLPLVLIPLHPMIDQPMIARAVENAGAGLALPKHASSARIASAARRVLGEPGSGEAAARLGWGIRAATAARRAADAISAVLLPR